MYRRHRHGYTLIEIVVVIAIVAILAAVLLPSYQYARAQGQMTSCAGTLRTLVTGLNDFSTQNGGRFPTALSQLAPTHLGRIPTCPSAGRDTYSAGYSVANNPTAFTVLCSGSNHTSVGLAPDHPRYALSTGLQFASASEAAAPAAPSGGGGNGGGNGGNGNANGNGKGKGKGN